MLSMSFGFVPPVTDKLEEALSLALPLAWLVSPPSSDIAIVMFA
jgi:hypothetical protein